MLLSFNKRDDYRNPASNMDPARFQVKSKQIWLPSNCHLTWRNLEISLIATWARSPEYDGFIGNRCRMVELN